MTDQNQPVDELPDEDQGVASASTGLEADAAKPEGDAAAEEINSETVADEAATEDSESYEDSQSSNAAESAAETEAAGETEVAAEAEESSETETEAAPEEEVSARQWYILKVASNRENSIRDGLARRVKIAELDEYFGDIVVPVEEIAEFKNGKRRVTKRKMYPGYILVHMEINDDTWFLVRETPGIGDFTGAAGKPTPMEPHEVQRILHKPTEDSEGAEKIKTVIPFNVADHVRVKDGHFENFEGDVESIDETHGRVTIMINIFGRPTPVELEHWQVELV